MPKTPAERAREYRARKKLFNQQKPPAQTATQRIREYRARQKALRNAAATIGESETPSTNFSGSRKLSIVNPDNPQPSTSRGDDIFLKQLEYPVECAKDILNHPEQDMKNVNCEIIYIKEEFTHLELENEVEEKSEDICGFANQWKNLEDNTEGDSIIKTDAGIKNDFKCADIVHMKKEETSITDINDVHIEPTENVIVAELNNKSVTSSTYLVDESKRCNETIQRPECYHCGYTFYNKCTLVKHIRRHTGERPYSCSYCGARFTRSSTLVVHVRRHTGERPYKCDQCDAKFALNASLARHMKIHSGDKHHQCRYCTVKFTAKSNLVVHERIHTNDKPYRCEKCIDRFTQSSSLKRHMKTHTNEGPYMCNACKVGFHREFCLNRHLKIHALKMLDLLRQSN